VRKRNPWDNKIYTWEEFRVRMRFEYSEMENRRFWENECIALDPPPPPSPSNTPGPPSSCTTPKAGSATETPKAQPKPKSRNIANPKMKDGAHPKVKARAATKAQARADNNTSNMSSGARDRSASLGPRVKKVLSEKFHGYQGEMPPMPEAELHWTDTDIHNFFFTSGFVRPKIKKSPLPLIPPVVLAQHYHTLGLKNGEKAAEVRRSYRQLALKYHPDKNRDSKKATTKFQEITEAYEVICQVLEGKLKSS